MSASTVDQRARESRPGRRLAFAAAAAVAGMVLSGCSVDVAPSLVDGDDIDGTFVVGTASAPVTLDPAFAADVESQRITRQIFEGLVGLEPGTADPAPLLADEWEVSEDGLDYTFGLREGVVFHDGTPFDAAAVCANFDRQDAFTGVALELSEPLWGRLMRPLAPAGEDPADPTLGDPADSDPSGAGPTDSTDPSDPVGSSIYRSCEAVDEHEVVISLTEPRPGFVAALGLPALAIQSPTALAEFAADAVGGTAGDPEPSEYATAHPTGTGPYVLASTEPGEQTVLRAFEDYWGDRGQVREVVVTVLGGADERREALETGEIDAYDDVPYADLPVLAEGGYPLIDRSPLDLVYLGMNQRVTALADPEVREAIALAIDPERFIAAALPERSTPAREFLPPGVSGWTQRVPAPVFDPREARDLLDEAGYGDEAGLTLTLVYPADPLLPYLPDPAAAADEITARLLAAGIEVEPVPVPIGGYEDAVLAGEGALFFGGVSADHNDPEAFLGALFEDPAERWGFTDEAIEDGLVLARSAETDRASVLAYERLSIAIMQRQPGVPLAHPTSTLAFSPRVASYPASPVRDEVYNRVTLAE